MTGKRTGLPWWSPEERTLLDEATERARVFDLGDKRDGWPARFRLFTLRRKAKR